MLKGPRKNIWNASLLLFLALFVLSFAFYSQASDESNAKNFFQDTDGDGLSNDEEQSLGTNPTVADTDGDGYSDGVEVESGFNPLIAAPGDKIIPEEVIADAKSGSDSNQVNFTQKASTELASIVKDVTSSSDPNASVSSEDIDTALQNALATSTTEIVLPEVDMKDFKIKKIPKNLKGDAKKEREKRDVIEYLTLMSYVLISNSPVSIQSEKDIEKVAQEISSNSLNALTAGDFKYLDSLEEQGNKFLEQIKDIEVPEAMIDTHMKAIQLAKYATTLKQEIKGRSDDPLGQVAAYGKVQAYFTEIESFSREVQTKLTSYGISDIPFSL